MLLTNVVIIIASDAQTSKVIKITGNCGIPNGQTVFEHSTEVIVQKCNSLHCFHYTMTYSVPLFQMVALIESSKNCSQSIKLDCSSAPCAHTVSKIIQKF